MAIPFLLDDAGKSELQRIRTYGEQHPVLLDTMKAIKEKRTRPMGDNRHYACVLPPLKSAAKWPHRFRIVFTVEQHPNKHDDGATWCRHMSASILDSKDRMPNEVVLHTLMHELGFWQVIDRCVVYTEDFGAGKAVNIIGERDRPEKTCNAPQGVV